MGPESDIVPGMRVWLAPSRFAPHLGGIETVVSDLARELMCVGDEVLILTHRHPVELPEDDAVEGVRVRRLRFESPARSARQVSRFFHSYRSVRVALDAEPRPDVIHLHGGSSQMFHLARYAADRRVPLVLTTHGEITMDVEHLYQRSAFIRASFRLAARKAAVVTAPSRYTLEEATALAGRLAGRGKVVPNGIRAASWRTTTPAQATQRVLAWGRLEPQKGFDRLVDVWSEVRRQIPGAELRIAGSGGQLADFRTRAHTGVTFLGRLNRPELVRELETTQFAAVPSRMEAFGMSALEALAAGRMVLHSGLPALNDLVGAYGWVAPHEDRGALAAAFVAALSQPPQVVPSRAVAQYEWPAVVEQYRTLYASTAPPNARP